MFDWDEGDRFSFEDSDRFEEDSLCSWMSEPESVCNNWRGWKKNLSAHYNSHLNGQKSKDAVLSLVELAAREVACSIPFEVVEHVYPPVPEQLQLRIAYWSFPDNEEDIRLYSCLANGSSDEFNRGENLLKARSVREMLQIGFHLSATVTPPQSLGSSKGSYNVAVTFDRRRITSCNCTCNSPASWCSHVVAVCLSRIHQPNHVCLRAPVSESLSRLHRDQLQKFAQYLISELPQQILPTAQRLLDELLSSQQTAINTLCGAPDPTAGASVQEQTTWCLDESQLHENIHKILIKLCVPSPIVFSDVNYLSSTAPPAAAEWSSLLRPLRGREPEGMWNLLSIVREMFRRSDRNAIPLLEILTEEVLACDQIITWWFNTKVSLHVGNSGHGNRSSIHSNTHASQHACSSLCDEIVFLWRLAALNPGLSPEDRSTFYHQLHEWHVKTLQMVYKVRTNTNNSNANHVKRSDFDVFPGFKPALEACLLDWSDYPIPGVTYAESRSKRWYSPCVHASGAAGSLISSSGYSAHQAQAQAASVAAVAAAANDSSSQEALVISTFQLSHPLSTSNSSNIPSRGRSVEINPQSIVTSSGPSLSNNNFPNSAQEEPQQSSSSSPSTSSSSLPHTSVCSLDAKVNGDSQNGPFVGTSTINGPQDISHQSAVSSPRPIPSSSLKCKDPINDDVDFKIDSNRSSLSSEGFCETENEQSDGLGVYSLIKELNELSIEADGTGKDMAKDSHLERASGSQGAKLSSSSEDKSSSSDSSSQNETNDLMKGAHNPSDNLNMFQSDCKPSTSSSSFSPACFSIAPKSMEPSQEKTPTKDLAVGNQEPAVLSPNRVSPASEPKPSSSFVSQPSTSQNQSSPSFAAAASSSAGLSASTSRPLPNHNNVSSGSNNENDLFAVNFKKMEDSLEILFARAEALHAHGHTQEACRLALKLADELLVNPPNLMIDIPNPPVRGKRGRRFNPACHQISLLASATLSKAAFLCSVLSENSEFHYLAFRVGLFGLEMARPPASTKALEVKLANQEQELVGLLKKIPLTPDKLKIIREKAEQLRDGKLRSRGDALLPLMLASYVFDALVLSSSQQSASTSKSAIPVISGKQPGDELLGFEAAVAALGLKANVSEAEHPLLCEGTRRQRGELAITLLVHYKDDAPKLAKIMDKLLDKEVHQMYKNPACSFESSIAMQNNEESVPSTGGSSPDTAQSSTLREDTSASAGGGGSGSSSATATPFERRDSGCETSGPAAAASSSRLQPSGSDRFSSERGPTSSPNWDEDYKAWEARFRCTNLKTAKKHSVGMASIDSSAPETTSSDNSPTVVRRSLWVRPGGPGSDSGSSGESSDSFASSSSGDKVARLKGATRETESPQLNLMANRLAASCTTSDVTVSASGPSRCQPPPPASTLVTTTSSTASTSGLQMPSSTLTQPPTVGQPMKPTRFKGKRAYPSVPNQPSEASAHFMFELAKTVLTKAGGSSSTAVLFTQPAASQNHRGPHRALHMSAFQIGLYALGLHNAVSPNWLSRTYSSHVSWITGQAMEIGAPAISFLIDTWEGHLTPPEVASLADRASRNRDPVMVRAAAELALSCLPHAHALNPNEIQRALIQCKEQSSEMLERACLAVESAAKGGGVYPEVLFEVARKWYQLYEENLQDATGRGRSTRGSRNSPNSEDTSAHNIGEFVVPTSNSSNTSTTESQHQAAALALHHHHHHQEQRHMEPIFVPHSIPQAVTTTVAVTQPMPMPVMPPMNCPPGAYGLPPASYPYGFFQGMPAYPQPSPISVHPAYIPAPANTYPFAFYASNPPTSNNGGMQHMRPPLPMMFPGVVSNVGQGPPPGPHMNTRPTLTFTLAPPTSLANHIPVAVSVATALPAQAQQPLQQLNQRQLNYLLSAYRVGMLAMETLARRVHDDRPAAKYARNPSYGEDVKWLLGVAKKIGTSYLQDFCMCTVNSVASPFVLHDIILETAQYLASANPTIAHPLRSHLLTPLIQKCQQMFIACTHFKMYHITPADYDEFVQTIRSARSAFQLTQGGIVQFNELLQSLRRSKSCKKELWQHISNALQTSI